MTHWHPNIPEEYRDQIITGDARVLAERLPDESVDLVLTDPPFGIGFVYSNGYQDDPQQYEALIRWLVAEAERLLKPGGWAFVYQSMTRLRETWGWFPADSLIFAACKNFVQLNRGAIPHAYDPVVYWQKPGGDYRRLTTRDWHLADTANMRESGLRGVPRATFHSCPRPASTVLYLIENCCPAGGLVVDFFAGSGTTAIAAKLAGMCSVSFEVEPHTAAQARERLRMIPVPLFVPEREPDPTLDLCEARR